MFVYVMKHERNKMRKGFRELSITLESFEDLDENKLDLSTIERQAIEVHIDDFMEAHNIAMETIAEYDSMVTTLFRANKRLSTLKEIVNEGNLNKSTVKLIVSVANETINDEYDVKKLDIQPFNISDAAIESIDHNEVVDVAIETIGDFIKKVWDKIKAWFKKIFGTTEKAIKSAVSKLEDFEEALYQLIKKFDGKEDKIKDSENKFTDDEKAKFSNFKLLAKTLGISKIVDLINTNGQILLLNGISEKFNKPITGDERDYKTFLESIKSVIKTYGGVYEVDKLSKLKTDSETAKKGLVNNNWESVTKDVLLLSSFSGKTVTGLRITAGKAGKEDKLDSIVFKNVSYTIDDSVVKQGIDAITDDKITEFVDKTMVLSDVKAHHNVFKGGQYYKREIELLKQVQKDIDRGVKDIDKLDEAILASGKEVFTHYQKLVTGFAGAVNTYLNLVEANRATYIRNFIANANIVLNKLEDKKKS